MDIAQKTGVNISTVSRALNNSSAISYETKRQILTAAEQLGYKPSGRKQPGVAVGNVAAMIVPEVQSGYYARLVHTAQQRFSQKGYYTMLSLTNFDPAQMIQALHMSVYAQARCILVVVDDNEEVCEDVLSVVRSIDVPVLFITAKYIGSMDFDCIYTDERRGTIMAIEHLLQEGYERIGYIGDEYTENRYRVYCEVMGYFKVDIDPRFAAIGADRAELGGYLRMREILSHDVYPDAVYAAYDQMAIGAIRAIEEVGLRIPDDIAIIGFDDITAAEYVNGGITTIANPYQDMVAIAVRILLQRVRTPHVTPQQIALKPDLVIRKTTR